MEKSVTIGVSSLYTEKQPTNGKGNQKKLPYSSLHVSVLFEILKVIMYSGTDFPTE